MTKLNFLPAEVAEKNEELRELQFLLQEISARDLPEDTVLEINRKTAELMSFEDSSKEAVKKGKTVKEEILKLLREKHDLIPEKYYTTLWLTLGMSAFGLPFGVALFAFTENPAFIAVGLPLGMGLGAVYGANLDKKTEAEGKVLRSQKKEEKK